jgi:hypothetical protein
VSYQKERARPKLLDVLQWLDAATLDKAVEMKVSFYPAHLKARLRLIEEVDLENLRIELPTTGP